MVVLRCLQAAVPPRAFGRLWEVDPAAETACSAGRAASPLAPLAYWVACWVVFSTFQVCNVEHVVCRAHQHRITQLSSGKTLFDNNVLMPTLQGLL